MITHVAHHRISLYLSKLAVSPKAQYAVAYASPFAPFGGFGGSAVVPGGIPRLLGSTVSFRSSRKVLPFAFGARCRTPRANPSRAGQLTRKARQSFTKINPLSRSPDTASRVWQKSTTSYTAGRLYHFSYATFLAEHVVEVDRPFTI